MKKYNVYCTISLSAVLLLGAAVAYADTGAGAAAHAVAIDKGLCRVKGDRVNLRARPLHNAEIITQLKKGDEVKVLETKTVGEGNKTQEWARITLPASAKCYVLAKLLTDGKANAEAINIRSGPGTSFKEVGKLAKGDKVTVVKAGGEWTQVKPTDKCTGWVASSLLEVVPAPAVVPIAPPVVAPEIAPAPPVSNIVPAAPAVTAAMPPPPPAPAAPTPAPPADVERLEYFVVRDGIFQTVDDEEKKIEKALTSYELMTIMVDRLQYRVAYLDMAPQSLDKYEGKHVRVIGNLRWKRGDRYPVIIVDHIEPVW
jgi:SH3-like domain-containing protein